MKSANILEIPYLRPLGRFHRGSAEREGVLPLFWACSGVELRFTGTALAVQLEADYHRLEPWIAVELNGAPLIRMPVEQGSSRVLLFQGMESGSVKRVRIMKDCQPMGADGDPRHRLWIRGLEWEGGRFQPLPKPSCRIEFVGDSLTSGEGLAGRREENAWTPALFSASRSWASLTAGMLDADFRVVSQSGWGIRSGWDNNPAHALPDWYEPVCATASGAANRALGAREHNDFAGWPADAVVINLGTNDSGAMNNAPWQDGKGGTFKQEDTPEGRQLVEESALAFLRKLRRLHPHAKLVWAYGMAWNALRPQLERAVERFRAEGGEAWYLPLPEATEETMGSRNHPGPLCHRQAAEAMAALLREILSLNKPQRTQSKPIKV